MELRVVSRAFDVQNRKNLRNIHLLQYTVGQIMFKYPLILKVKRKILIFICRIIFGIDFASFLVLDVSKFSDLLSVYTLIFPIYKQTKLSIIIIITIERNVPTQRNEMTFLDFTSKQKNFFNYKIKNLPQQQKQNKKIEIYKFIKTCYISLIKYMCLFLLLLCIFLSRQNLNSVVRKSSKTKVVRNSENHLSNLMENSKMPSCEIGGLQSTIKLFKKPSTSDSKKIQEISLKNQVSQQVVVFTKKLK